MDAPRDEKAIGTSSSRVMAIVSLAAALFAVIVTHGVLSAWFPAHAGGDAYVLKYIIHDCDDPRAGAILAACRRAMPPDGTVVVVERLLPERAQVGVETDVYFIDLEMLALTPGRRERAEDEFRQLFAAAGFALEQVVPTALPFRGFEGRPV